jgi:hypothetical protein
MTDWHYDLALNQELEVAEEILASWVLEEIDGFKEEVPIGEGPEQKGADLAPHQFAQLLTVAEENASVPALVNYVRYQIARAEQGRGWHWQNIGQRIVRLMQEPVRGEAKNAASRAAERIRGRGAVATKGEKRQAWVRLSRLFVGLLRRRFVQRSNDLAHQQSAGGDA